MQYFQNIVIYLTIPLVLFSILSLLENIQAQTSSTNQTAPPKNQAMNLTVQALMKVDREELKDTLMNAKVEIVNRNLDEALTTVRDIETQFLLIEPPPTKFLADIHKITNAIVRSDIDKSLDSLTKVQIDILKAENQIFKAAVANPQLIQQFTDYQEDTE
jgi:hypothetical protein